MLMILFLQLVLWLSHTPAEAFVTDNFFLLGWIDTFLDVVCGVPLVGFLFFCADDETTTNSAFREFKIRARDGAAVDQFGSAVSVSSSGRAVVVGAPYDDGEGDGDNLHNSGSAYIFSQQNEPNETGDGNWIQEAKLVPSPPGHSGDMFGRSVHMDGDSVIVGAPHHDHHHNNGDGGVVVEKDQGSAYIFGWQQQAWTQQAKLTAFDGRGYDRFGISVAMSQDTAAVGASADDDGGGNSGGVYVYGRATATSSSTDDEWTRQAKLRAGDAGSNAQFGESVSLAVGGDLLAVGAPGDQSNRGAVYVFARNEVAEWTQQAKLVASDGNHGDRFGESVALCGDDSCSQPTVLVGAAQHLPHGAAYIFVLEDDAGTTAAAWTQQAKLTAPDVVDTTSAAPRGLFGNSVSVSQDVAAVGAELDGAERGAVYTFQKQQQQWTFQDKLRADDGAARDRFGAAVGLSGRTAIVGSPVDDNDSGLSSGGAYLFQLSQVDDDDDDY